MKKKNIVLSDLENSNKKAVLSLQESEYGVEGTLRLYNFPSQLSGIYSLGIYAQNKVFKAGLTQKKQMLFQFFLDLKEIPEKFSVAVVNFQNAVPKPILFGSSEGSDDDVYSSIISTLSGQKPSYAKTKQVLDQFGFDYADEEKDIIEKEITDAMATDDCTNKILTNKNGTKENCADKCENCIYKYEFFEAKKCSNPCHETNVGEFNKSDCGCEIDERYCENNGGDCEIDDCRCETNERDCEKYGYSFEKHEGGCVKKYYQDDKNDCDCEQNYASITDENVKKSVDVESVFTTNVESQNKIAHKIASEDENKVEENVASEENANEQQKDMFFKRLKPQIDKLFEKNPVEKNLQNLIPSSKFVKVEYEDDGDFYVFGLLYDEDGQVRYVCYGIPAVYEENPPMELSGYPVFLPLDKADGFGYWLTYQDAETGEPVKAVID